MSTEVNNFVAALYVARSESVKRLQNISLCPRTTPPNCVSDSTWHQGLILFSNVNGSNVVIQQNPALPGVCFCFFCFCFVITFNPSGQSGTNDTFTFCDTGGFVF